MKLSQIFLSAAVLAFVSIAAPVLAAASNVATGLQRPQPQHKEFIDYMNLINKFAVDLNVALDVAHNTDNPRVDRMGTEYSIIDLTLAIADGTAALKTNKTVISNFRDIYNSLEELATQVDRTAKLIGYLSSAFKKYKQVDLVTAVLESFAYSISQLYVEIVKVSMSGDAGKGKAKRGLSAIISEIICQISTASHSLDPSKAMQDVDFCKLAGLDSHPSWTTSPVVIRGLENCPSGTEDVRQLICGMSENNAWAVKYREKNWCKCSKPADQWGPSSN